MTDFTMEKGADGVAIITWDCPGKTMNVMSIDGLSELDTLIDDVLGDEAVKGIVITSGKDGSFAGGMDLNLLAKLKEDAGDDPAKGLFEGTMRMHGLLRKIELAGMDRKTKKGGKPIAAALPGTAAGIGLELPLATHRIFLADNPKARVGLPEIMVGTSPARAAPRGWRAKWARWRPRPSCSRARWSSPRPRNRPGWWTRSWPTRSPPRRSGCFRRRMRTW